MKLCAIILDYRGAARTRACLETLIGQGIDLAIVVDNSEDVQASQALDLALAEFQRASPGYIVRTLRPARNLGFARGVNLALGDPGAAGCELFLLINNDAYAHPGMLASMARTLREQAADLVAPLVVDGAGTAQPQFRYQRHLGILSPRNMPFSFPYLSGCCLLFRRELLRDGKLFDEDFFMYGEDTLLGWELARAGKKLVIDRHACVSHAGRGSSRENKIFYEYHMARAHVLLAMKAFRTPLEIPLLLAGKFMALGCRAVLRSARSRSLVPLAAFVLAWFPLSIRAAR